MAASMKPLWFNESGTEPKELTTVALDPDGKHIWVAEYSVKDPPGTKHELHRIVAATDKLETRITINDPVIHGVNEELAIEYILYAQGTGYDQGIWVAGLSGSLWFVPKDTASGGKATLVYNDPSRKFRSLALISDGSLIGVVDEENNDLLIFSGASVTAGMALKNTISLKLPSDASPSGASDLMGEFLYDAPRSIGWFAVFAKGFPSGEKKGGRVGYVKFGAAPTVAAVVSDLIDKPYGLAVNTKGRLFVANTAKDNVLAIDYNNGKPNVTVFAANVPTASYVMVDPYDYVWVTDDQQTLRELDPDGHVVDTIALKEGTTSMDAGWIAYQTASDTIIVTDRSRVGLLLAVTPGDPVPADFKGPGTIKVAPANATAAPNSNVVQWTITTLDLTNAPVSVKTVQLTIDDPTHGGFDAAKSSTSTVDTTGTPAKATISNLKTSTKAGDRFTVNISRRGFSPATFPVTLKTAYTAQVMADPTPRSTQINTLFGQPGKEIKVTVAPAEAGVNVKIDLSGPVGGAATFQSGGASVTKQTAANGTITFPPIKAGAAVGNVVIKIYVADNPAPVQTLTWVVAKALSLKPDGGVGKDIKVNHSEILTQKVIVSRTTRDVQTPDGIPNLPVKLIITNGYNATKGFYFSVSADHVDTATAITNSAGEITFDPNSGLVLVAGSRGQDATISVYVDNADAPSTLIGTMTVQTSN